MAWRVAKSLETLRLQLNTLFPNRDKKSDGGIGDPNHASRASDHNPWVKDSKGMGIVTARDFTHDPKNGLDCNALAAVLIASRDPRIKYLIWNRQIVSSKQQPWIWRRYSGANSHSHHLHISVDADPTLYDSIDEWNLSALSAPGRPQVSPQSEAEKPTSSPLVYTVKSGDNLTKIGKLYGLKAEDLMRINKLKSDVIQPGQRLKIK